MRVGEWEPMQNTRQKGRSLFHHDTPAKSSLFLLAECVDWANISVLEISDLARFLRAFAAVAPFTRRALSPTLPVLTSSLYDRKYASIGDVVSGRI